MSELNPKVSEIDRIMIKAHRKQVPLCRACHLEHHKAETPSLRRKSQNRKKKGQDRQVSYHLDAGRARKRAVSYKLDEEVPTVEAQISAVRLRASHVFNIYINIYL